MSSSNSRVNDWLIASKHLIVLASGIIFTALGQEFQQVSTILSVGLLGDPSFIGAATLGNMLCNISGFSLMYGMCSGLDSLISQSFGAQLYKDMGIHAQRAILILTLFSIPTALFWSVGDIVLIRVLNIPSDIAMLAGIWSRILCLGLWPSLIFECLKKFLQGQNIVWPVVVSTFIGLGTNILVNFFSYKAGGGFEGCALAIPITNWVQLIVLISLIFIRKHCCLLRKGDGHGGGFVVQECNDTGYSVVSIDESEHGGKIELVSSMESGVVPESKKEFKKVELDPEDNWPPMSNPALFSDWWLFLRLGIPSAMSLFIEWGSFELAASIAGQLGPASLATHGLYMSVAGIFYLTPQVRAMRRYDIVTVDFTAHR